MKQKILSMVYVTLISTSVVAMDDYRSSDICLCDEKKTTESVDSLDAAFTQGKVDGNIRLAHIYQRDDVIGSKNNYATSIGGQLKYETARFYNLSGTFSTFVSQKITPLSGDMNHNSLNTDFFNDKGSSIVYVGEAYVDYKQDKFELRVGRQKLDTPLNDRDDIRMLPNTFQGATLGYGGLDHFVFTAGYLTKWAGYDSGQDISKFKYIPGELSTTNENGKKLYILGMQNNSFKNFEMQAWYYGFDKQADVLYLEGIYEAAYGDLLNFVGGVQYGHYEEKDASTIEGDVFGIQIEASVGVLTFSAAVNYVMTDDGKTIIIGYGGGPYFTSMEEMTIDQVNDVKAYTLGAGIDMGVIAENLELIYAYGEFAGKDGTGDLKVVEHDLILGYPFNDTFDLEVSYADIHDKANSGTADIGFDRLLVRMNYVF